MPKLTPQQNKVFNFIKSYLIKHNVSPTYQEIADSLGIIIPTVQGYIKEIILKGYLVKTKRVRGLQLVSQENIVAYGFTTFPRTVDADTNKIGAVEIRQTDWIEYSKIKVDDKFWAEHTVKKISKKGPIIASTHETNIYVPWDRIKKHSPVKTKLEGAKEKLKQITDEFLQGLYRSDKVLLKALDLYYQLKKDVEDLSNY